MARKALKVKHLKLKLKHLKALAAGKNQIPTRVYNRCGKCGRIGGYMRYFDLCRICFRELASQGLILALKKLLVT